MICKYCKKDIFGYQPKIAVKFYAYIQFSTHLYGDDLSDIELEEDFYNYNNDKIKIICPHCYKGNSDGIPEIIKKKVKEKLGG